MPKVGSHAQVGDLHLEIYRIDENRWDWKVLPKGRERPNGDDLTGTCDSLQAAQSAAIRAAKLSPGTAVTWKDIGSA